MQSREHYSNSVCRQKLVEGEIFEFPSSDFNQAFYRQDGNGEDLPPIFEERDNKKFFMIADGHGGRKNHNDIIILLQNYQDDIKDIAYEFDPLEALKFIEERIINDCPNTTHGCMIIIGIINSETEELSYISVGDCSLIMMERYEIIHTNMKHKLGSQMDEFSHSKQFLKDNYDIEKISYEGPRWIIEQDGSVSIGNEQFIRFHKKHNFINFKNSCFLTLNSYTKPSEKIDLITIPFDKSTARLFVGSDGIFDLVHENDQVMIDELEEIINVVNERDIEREWNVIYNNNHAIKNYCLGGDDKSIILINM